MSTSNHIKLDLQHNHLAATSTRFEVNYVSCKTCHKLFKGELYLLKHVHLKHPDVQKSCGMDKQIVSENENEMQDQDPDVSFCSGISDNVDIFNSSSTGQIITQKTNAHTEMIINESDHKIQDLHLTPSESFPHETNDSKTSVPNSSQSCEIITQKKSGDTEMKIKSESDRSELDVMGPLHDVKTENEHVEDSTSKHDGQDIAAQTIIDGNHVTCLVCNKVFSEQRYLDKHMKGKHQLKEERETILEINGESRDRNEAGDINTIECSVCGLRFKKITEYTHHLKVHLELDKESKRCVHANLAVCVDCFGTIGLRRSESG